MLLDNRTDRNSLRTIDDPINQAVIHLPNLDSAGAWSQKYMDKITKAEASKLQVDQVIKQIQLAKKSGLRNAYQLDVYEQVAQVVQFSNQAILTLADYDEPSGEKRAQGQAKLAAMEEEWASIQSKVEEVYGKTRQIHKPADYNLDQDHHRHLANQALKFSNWQFYVEGLFLEKVKIFLQNN